MIVALGYQSRVGKDTLAGYLVEELEVRGIDARRVSFASALKASAHEAFVHYGLRSGAFYDTLEGAPLRTIPLPGINLSPVDIWVRFGEACKSIHPPIWCDRVMEQVDSNPPPVWWILSDLRFPLEGHAVHERGGATVLVLRPGQETHGCDHALSAWDWTHVVGNLGDLRDLRGKASRLVTRLLERAP